MTTIQNHLNSTRAMTLIETLTVIALLTIVASTMLIHTASVQDDAKARAAAESVRNLDRQARLWSRVCGRVAVKIDDANGPRIVLRSLADGQVLLERDLPPGLNLEFRTGQPTASIVFDATGRSPDYSIRVVGGERIIELHVSGSTGLITSSGDST